MLVLDETHSMLKSAAAEFLAARAPVKALRDLRDSGNTAGFDRDLWQEMGALGWPGVLVPEIWGGSGLGYQGLGQILEEAGHTLLASPLLSSSVVATSLLLSAGSPAQQAAWLPRLASGDVIATLALDEQPRHQPRAIATRALPTPGGYRLHGHKCFVPDGQVADLLLVVAGIEDRVAGAEGLAVFVIAADTPGLVRERLAMVDCRSAARLQLDGVQVAADARLGEGTAITAALTRALDAGRAGLAAEMLGNGQEAFARTLRYLKLREQFGVPIGSFQALKHRAALMYCEIELTRSAVRAALDALDTDPESVALLASVAKAKACDMLELVTSEAVQMHGGIGMTDAEEIGFFLKRARVAQQLYGDAGFHRDRYATLRGF